MLKKEFNSLKIRDSKSILNKNFLIFLFYISVIHNDLKFAHTLLKEYNIENIDTIEAKIALGSFYFSVYLPNKVVYYLLPIFRNNNKKLEMHDLGKLYYSLLKMAMFKDAEDILRYALDIYSDIKYWNFEALEFQIITSHLNSSNKQHIINNLNFLVKNLLEEPNDYKYMGRCFYHAGYYQQSFNMYDKYCSLIKIDSKREYIEYNHFNSQNTLDSMNEIIDIISKMNIVSFPIAGSLLGLVRDGKFFNHDKDADIGLFMDNYEDISTLVSSLCKHKKFIAPSMVSKPKEYALWNVAIYDTDRHTAVDLFFFHRKKNYVEFGINTKNGVVKWLFKPFELKKHILAGREYYVPKDYEDWLTQMYGKWNETVVVWESLINCPNLAKESQVPIIYYSFIKLIDAISKKSLVKFDNIYNTMTTRWKYKFSLEAENNLKKIRLELNNGESKIE